MNTILKNCLLVHIRQFINARRRNYAQVQWKYLRYFMFFALRVLTICVVFSTMPLVPAKMDIQYIFSTAQSK